MEYKKNDAMTGYIIASFFYSSKTLFQAVDSNHILPVAW